MSTPPQNGAPTQINLGQLADSGHKYEVTVVNESPEEAQARRARDAADADLKRKMTYGVFIFALIAVGVVFCGCVFVFATGTPDDKKWTAGIVSAIASGLVGFLVGQGKK